MTAFEMTTTASCDEWASHREKLNSLSSDLTFRCHGDQFRASLILTLKIQSVKSVKSVKSAKSVDTKDCDQASQNGSRGPSETRKVSHSQELRIAVFRRVFSHGFTRMKHGLGQRVLSVF